MTVNEKEVLIRPKILINADQIMIPFNKPYITGKEVHYVYDAVASGHLSGNGKYTKLCQNYFQKKFNFKKALLTTSCTDALEMCALLLNIQPGDEVIVPSYTFVSTAVAFVRQGANIIFADSRNNHPNIDEDKIESLITERTKAIVVVHYAGVACDMDKIMAISNKFNIPIIEDAAQAIDSFYISSDGHKKALGTIGHLSAFSFHETKNIQCGEGGMLAVNDEAYAKRAEILWEKGTNRAEFFRGEVNKYGWVDTGSSFLPSEITAAFLWAQLDDLDKIQSKRKALWSTYNGMLKDWAESRGIMLPYIPSNATNNAHMFYLICRDIEQRTALIKHLRDNDILAVFHYLSLHKSPFYKDRYKGNELPFSDKYSDTLVRLPFFFELEGERLNKVISTLLNF